MAFCSALLAPVSFALGLQPWSPVHLADRIKVGAETRSQAAGPGFPRRVAKEAAGRDDIGRLLLSSLFARMFAGGCRVFVSLFAMFVSRFGVLLRLFVLAKIMVVGCLMMMMCGRVVMRGRLMMVLTGRMLRGLCHGAVPPNRSLKTDAGYS